MSTTIFRIILILCIDILQKMCYSIGPLICKQCCYSISIQKLFWTEQTGHMPTSYRAEAFLPVSVWVSFLYLQLIWPLLSSVDWTVLFYSYVSLFSSFWWDYIIILWLFYIKRWCMSIKICASLVHLFVRDLVQASVQTFFSTALTIASIDKLIPIQTAQLSRMFFIEISLGINSSRFSSISAHVLIFVWIEYIIAHIDSFLV